MSVPPLPGFYRNLFGALALIVIAAIRREVPWRGWRPLGFAAIAGAFFAVDIFCWHRSIHYIGPGLATIMGNLQVIILGAVGIFIFKEKFTWRFAASIPLAIAGLVMLVGLKWSEVDSSYRIGVWLGVATAGSYAGYLLALRRGQVDPNRLSATVNLAWVTVVTTVLLAVIARVEGGSLHVPDAKAWSILIAYGVICQALGWIIISSALRKVEASRAGLLLLLQPTLTFIWDMVFFGRPTTVIEGAGAMLALGAIHLGSGRKSG